jgi:hypothetical protein
VFCGDLDFVSINIFFSPLHWFKTRDPGDHIEKYLTLLHVAPPEPWKSWRLIELILHFVRKLRCISALFWPCYSWEQNIYMRLPYFCYHPLLQRAWLFIWTNLNPLHATIICIKFDLNWTPGSGEHFKR